MVTGLSSLIVVKDLRKHEEARLDQKRNKNMHTMSQQKQQNENPILYLYTLSYVLHQRKSANILTGKKLNVHFTICFTVCGQIQFQKRNFLVMSKIPNVKFT